MVGIKIPPPKVMFTHNLSFLLLSNKLRCIFIDLSLPDLPASTHLACFRRPVVSLSPPLWGPPGAPGRPWGLGARGARGLRSGAGALARGGDAGAGADRLRNGPEPRRTAATSRCCGFVSHSFRGGGGGGDDYCFFPSGGGGDLLILFFLLTKLLVSSGGLEGRTRDGVS